MDLVTLISQSMGSAWASGINLYATCTVLGLLGRSDVVELNGKLSVIESWWVIVPAAAMYCVEFIADKIPLFDSAWDAIHTFVRVPAGAILAASTFSDVGTAAQAAAFVSGGAIALESHSIKATARAAINTSPEPITNWIASLAEDAFVVSLLLFGFALDHPGWFLLVLAAVVLAGAAALYLLWKFIRTVFARIARTLGSA